MILVFLVNVSNNGNVATDSWLGDAYNNKRANASFTVNVTNISSEKLTGWYFFRC